MSVLVAVAFLAGSWAFLHWWRPAVNGSYRGSVTSTLALGTGHGGVRWTLPSGALALGVTLDGGPASSEGSLVLPVAPTKCDHIANELGLSCDQGVIAAPTGFFCFWTRLSWCT